MTSSLHLLLADEGSGLSGVPADFIKYFLMVCGFILTAWVAYKKGSSASGQANDPLHVHQPLKVEKSEAQALKELIASHTRENLRQHEATALRINEIIKTGGERGEAILNAIHSMEQRVRMDMQDQAKDVYDRLNPVAETVRAHASAITSLERRCSEIWDWVCKCWEHITKIKK